MTAADARGPGRRWYAPRAKWGSRPLGRTVAIVLGVAWGLILIGNAGLLYFGDRGTAFTAARVLIVAGAGGLTYVYFAHAIFNTTSGAASPPSTTSQEDQ